MIRAHPKSRAYKGFWLSPDGGPDARWIARHDDGRKVRADTLTGVKEMVSMS